MASKPIKIEITGDATKFEKELGKTQEGLKKFGKAAAIGAAAVGTAAVAAGAALFSIGSDFDTMKTNIVKGTGATGDALDGLFESAKDVMSNVPDSGELVSNTLADVNTFFGATGDELSSLTEDMLDFSRLTGTDVGTNVEALDGIMTNFNMSIEESDELMGDLIRVTQATGVPMETMLATLDKYGPTFEAMGLNAEEASIMIGRMNEAGLDAESTGKFLDRIMLDAAENGLTGAEAFDEFTGSWENMTEAQKISQAELIVGAKNATAFTQAMNDGTISTDDFNDAIGDGAGLLDEQTEATASFSDKWNEFKNKVLVKLEPLATKLFEKIEGFMDWLSSDGIPAVESMVESFRSFSGWVRENSDYIIGALAAVATVVLITLGPAFIAWAIAAGAAAIATLLAIAPIILLVAAAAALGVAIVWLYKNWDEVWGKIKEVTGKAVDWVKDKVSRAWEAVKEYFTGLKDAAVTKMSEMKTAIVDKAQEIADDVKSWIGGIPQTIRDLGSSFLDAGKALGGKILTGLKNGLTGALGFVSDIAGSLNRALKDKINTNVIDKINTGIRTFVSTVNRIPGVDVDAPQIARLFKGADDFEGGMAMVGEHGRELVTLPQGANVLTNANTEKVMGGATASQTINVSVQTNADPHLIARELAWQLRRS